MRRTILLLLMLVAAPAAMEPSPAPAGAITGKVFDSVGRPMRNSVVGLLRVVYTNGERSITVVEAQTTDRRGEFRIDPILPGEYYVGATPSRSAEMQTTTLHPNARNLDSATKVVVQSGEELQGIDIHVRAVPTESGGL
jgi:protocatechuate 3,4-dioxygenase beta subunit